MEVLINCILLSRLNIETRTLLLTTIIDLGNLLYDCVHISMITRIWKHTVEHAQRKAEGPQTMSQEELKEDLEVFIL